MRATVSRIRCVWVVVMAGCAFRPQEGWWQPVIGAFVVDRCGGVFENAARPFEPGVVSLTSTDGGFRLGEQRCVLERTDFRCEPVIELVVSGSTRFETSREDAGRFTDRTEAIGVGQVGFTCEGEQCESFAADNGFSFPCQAEVEMAWRYLGPEER